MVFPDHTHYFLCRCFIFQFGCFYQDESTVVFTSYPSVVTDRSRSQGNNKESLYMCNTTGMIAGRNSSVMYTQR